MKKGGDGRKRDRTGLAKNPQKLHGKKNHKKPKRVESTYRWNSKIIN